MKTTNRLISLFAGMLFATTMMADVVYEPMIVASGFNRDCIAESMPLNTSKVSSYLQETGFYYSLATESVIRTVNNNYQASHPGYFSDANLVDIPLQGWPDDPTNDPANRIIRCREDGDAISDPLYKDVFFQLAPYNENNVLTLRPDNCIGGTGTLKFKTVGCYDKVFFLLMSAFEGSKPSVRQVATTIYYTDGTSEDEIFEFAGLSGKEGHNVRKTNIYEDRYKKWSKADGNKAYAAIFDMNVDQSKLIDRIEFHNTINNTAVVIFAVTGRTADMEIPEEESMDVSNIEKTSFQACWDAITEAASYRIDVATDIDFQHILEDYNNLPVTGSTCQDIVDLVSNTDYYWRVRAVDSEGGQSASSAVRRVTTAPDPEKGDTPPYTDEEYTNIEDMLAPYIGTKSTLAELDIHRTLYRDGAFNTLCLPFDLNAAQIAASPLAGVDVYEYVRATQAANGQLDIEISGPIDHMTAGVPYLVKWAPTTPEIIGDEDGDGIGVLAFKNVNVVTNHGTTLGEEGEVRFVGNIGIATMVDEEQLGLDHNKLFLGAANTLYWPVDNTHLKGFRAYFLVPTTGAKAVAKHTPARIVMHTDVTTDVVTVNDERLTVSGTKILRDGQMYLIHDGLIYDVMGRKLSHNP